MSDGRKPVDDRNALGRNEGKVRVAHWHILLHP